MASISSPAATAAGGSSVTVEDESPISRRCCGCSSDRPESDFSGAQLKKKGKRVCKACVERREWAEAKAADDAAAAKSAARPHPSAASSSVPSASSPSSPSIAVVCIVCAKGGAKLRTCSRCRSLYCGAACLKLHSSGDTDQCAAIRSLPPLSIADEERITAEEIERHWPRMQRRMLSHMSHDPIFPTARRELAAVRLTDSALVRLYPPTPALPWWNSASAVSTRFRASIHAGAIVMFSAIYSIDMAYFSVHFEFRNATKELAELDALTPDRFFPLAPPALDESRLFHRMLRYLIYYYRHVDPSFIDPQLRPFVDVRSDDEGVLPACVDDDGNTRLVAYCTHADESGRRTLLPINVRLVKDKKSPFSRALTYLQQGGRVMMWEGDTRVNEPGLVIFVSQDSTDVTACTGRTADPAASWRLAPATMTYASTSVLQELSRDSEIPELMRAQLQSLLEPRSRSDYFHLVPALREALKDEWPDPSKCNTNEEAILFIATPRPGLESDLAELLLLESLADEAAAGDAHSRLLISHIEAECGATIGEVMAEQRSRLERMLADQRDQLRIHAEAVERHDQRGRMRLKANGGASGGDNGSGSDGSSSISSGGSSQSAAASISSSVAQLGESVGGLSPSSAVASASPHSAALSCSSAASSGVLSSDRAPVTAVGTATTASFAACSWTAAHRSLESLRAPGRKKYGPILRAALRFLHSLRPVSVNRGGGSHTVFHFARGSPVTLVQPHAGGRSRDGTIGAGYCTRLYQSLHSVALQQLQLGGTGSAGGSEVLTETLPASASAPRVALLPSPDSTAGASN